MTTYTFLRKHFVSKLPHDIDDNYYELLLKRQIYINHLKTERMASETVIDVSDKSLQLDFTLRFLYL